MKKLIFILLISYLTASAQDIEPTQIKFKLGQNTTYLSGDSSYFKQYHFMLGWAWGYGWKMSECLYDNQAHISTNYQKSWIKDSSLLIICSDSIYNKYGLYAVSNAQSLVYSPVLQIINPESQTNIRANDPHNAIFGFKNIQTLFSA